jgi:SAM-dependent methyltransferase
MATPRHTADVSVFCRRLQDEPQPLAAFDAAAAGYDAQFSATRLGRLLRQRVWDTLAEVFEPGQRILELGCGTGEDAVFLARRGISVLATDASAGMLAVARTKVAQAGVADRVRFAQIDAARLALDGNLSPRPSNDLVASGEPRSGDVASAYDGALADFGVLNCLGDRRRFGEALAERLTRGAALVAVVMGPLCVWEVAWYLLHGDLRRATRRWRSGALAQVGSARLPVWYPSPSRLRSELAATFELESLVGLGTLLPPSYLSHLVDRWPDLFTRLATLDQRVPGSPWLADHYVAVFERR